MSISARSAMTLTLDRRERLLSEALDGFPHEFKTLAAGDVLCRYEDNTEWIAERKTVNDLGKSIRTGRRLSWLST